MPLEPPLAITHSSVAPPSGASASATAVPEGRTRAGRVKVVPPRREPACTLAPPLQCGASVTPAVPAGTCAR